MAKLLGPDFLALQVKNLASSAKFYEELLGLERAPKSPPDAIVYQTSPIPFAIRKPLVDLSASTRLGWGVALWFQVDDADALYRHLSDNGIRIPMPIQDGAFGRQFAFIDPDGYTITVHGG